ncbi:hypothetical protein C0J52_05798 [Blattella germanica]|nr:hypothetical protein C0J52_05798 [Blattella germanica]
MENSSRCQYQFNAFLSNPLPRRAGEMYSLIAVVPWTASEHGELGVECKSQEESLQLRGPDVTSTVGNDH